MKRVRSNSKETTKKWLKNLNEIKQELSQNNHKKITEIIKSKNISHSWHGFLSSNNVIIKNEFGFYKWNDKIPITHKLIDKFRFYAYQYSLKKQPTLFDKPKANKTRKVKIEFKDKPKEQIGLIRKFWRWIY